MTDNNYEIDEIEIYNEILDAFLNSNSFYIPLYNGPGNICHPNLIQVNKISIDKNAPTAETRLAPILNYFGIRYRKCAMIYYRTK